MVGKAAMWGSHLAAWGESGLSQAAYCRCHGLSLACFGYWRGKLRQGSARVEPVANGLVPIMVAETTSSDDRIEVILPNGLRVQLPVGMEAARWMPMIRGLITC